MCCAVCWCCLQALPAPQLDGLPLLQQLLGDQRRLLGDDGSGAVASSSPQAAAAAFECLLRDGGPLAACPGEAAARAAFAAVAAGEPELAAMACRAFLAWCGAADDGAGGEARQRRWHAAELLRVRACPRAQPVLAVTPTLLLLPPAALLQRRCCCWVS